MLLLAVYLFAVLGHLAILRPLASNSFKFGVTKVAPADKLTDKSGGKGIKLKKIAKTVLNRSTLPQKGKVLNQLYVATLMHSVAFRTLHGSRSVGYAAFFGDFPVKRLYPLRI